MAKHIAAKGVHHFRLTVSDADRAVASYTQVLGFKKLIRTILGSLISKTSSARYHPTASVKLSTLLVARLAHVIRQGRLAVRCCTVQ